MRARATVLLKIPSSKILKTVRSSLSPEVYKPGLRKTDVIIRSDEPFLILTFEANDTTALRSALNAYLRWINSITNMAAVLDSFS